MVSLCFHFYDEIHDEKQVYVIDYLSNKKKTQNTIWLNKSRQKNFLALKITVIFFFVPPKYMKNINFGLTLFWHKKSSLITKKCSLFEQEKMPYFQGVFVLIFFPGGRTLWIHCQWYVFEILVLLSWIFFLWLRE